MRFNMSLVWVRFSTKDTTELFIGFFCEARTMKPTYPPFQGQVERFFVSLPIIFGPEDFGTKRALIRHDQRCGDGFFFQSAPPVGSFFARRSAYLERFLRSRGAVTGEFT